MEYKIEFKGHDKKYVLKTADYIWDAGVHDFEVRIAPQESTIIFTNKLSFERAKSAITCQQLMF